MNLKEAIERSPTAFTENGAETFATSRSAIVDFFFKAGSARNLPSAELCARFLQATDEDVRLAFQTLLWLRDIRGGAGEREAFRNILRSLVDVPQLNEFTQIVISVTPEFGRWDDLLVLMGTRLESDAVDTIREGFEDPNAEQLVAKWMPRKGPIAAKLRTYFQMSPREWRKFLVNRSNTVEQKMCANQWNEIEYSKVPSIATSRYRKAFARHDVVGYTEWKERLVKGEEKVNAGAIFPHDVIKGLLDPWNNDIPSPEVINAQWEALPNYLGSAKILPICDTSGSMFWARKSPLPIDVCVSLGLYLAMKQTGPFSGLAMTFSSNPQFIRIDSNDIVTVARGLSQAPWGGSTNLQASFELLLKVATRNNVPASEMPTQILILSDMEFNACAAGTNMDGIRAQYESAGYELPDVVFWNLNSRQWHNVPVQVTDKGVALVSGFSPSILKGILAGEVTPTNVFLNTVDVPRYQVF